MSMPKKLRFKDDDGRDFPEWEEKELGEIIELMQSGVSRLLNDSDVGLPVLRSTNLIDGKLNITELKYWYSVDNKGVNLENYFLKEGDLLVNFINSLAQIGKVALYEDLLKRKTIFTTNIMRLSFKKNANYKFIFCFFQTTDYEKHIQAITKPAVNQASFTTKEFKTLKVPFPSLKEQTKIANFLTAVDEKITQLTQKCDLLGQYKRGVMQQIFSQELRFKDDDGRDFPEWEGATLGELIYEKSTKYNPESQPENLKCIELEHLSQETGVLLGYVDAANQKSIKNRFNKGDVLFGKLRPYLKKFLKAPFDGVCSTEIWVLKGKKLANNYLYQLVQTENFLALTNISSGSKMPRADWGIVASAVIQYPALPEQTKIAHFLTAIDDKINNAQTQLAAVKQYKQGLLQQMFV